MARKGPTMLPLFQNFFSTADGSVKGFINAEELYRSILTAFGSASMIGLVMVVIQAILTNADSIFPNPSVAALASGLLTLVLDLLRRLNQGSTPSPAPAPSPAPVPAGN